ncbi:MAG TPA: alpha/beta fold hydrolase [Thermoleophilaceae bacterium]
MCGRATWRRTAAAAMAAACLAGAAATTAAAADEPLPPQGPSPAGTNDFHCKPPARHPYPVILVHGTYLNMSVSWVNAAPALTRLGYCVFALDYGNSPTPGVNGVGDIPKSARQLKTFVGKVLKATGAKKVSIVGHSQGGMMPRYLIKFLGGASIVDDLVGLSPSNHGTTNPLAGPAGANGCPACGQQVAGSDFIKHLNAGDQTPAPVSYTVIETRNDEVVTPFESEFLPKTADGRVTNVLLQDACAADATDHIGIIYDPVALQWMLNALGRPGPADPHFAVDCTGAGLATYPDTSSVGQGGSGDSGGSGGSGGSGSSGRARVRLVIGRAYRHASATRGRRFHVALAAGGGTARGVSLTLRSADGELLARARGITVSRRRTIVLRLEEALEPGRYTVSARGKDAAGHAVAAKRHVMLR